MMRQCEMKGEAAVCHQAQWQHERTPRGMTTRGHFVCPGGPADGRLVPGDQLVKINNVAVDDLTPEQAAEIIRSLPTAHTHAHTVIGPCATKTGFKMKPLYEIHI